MRNIIFLLIFIGAIYYGPNKEKLVTRAEIRQYHAEKVEELANSDVYRPTWDDVVEEIVKVFSQSGKEAVDWALRCFYSESKWNAFAINDTNRNGTTDRGVAQVNSVHGYSEAILFNYKENIRIAYQMYLDSGKTPWYGSGCY